MAHSSSRPSRAPAVVATVSGASVLIVVANDEVDTSGSCVLVRVGEAGEAKKEEKKRNYGRRSGFSKREEER
eukprot:scaffold26368_cov44-Skeletonema_dohrnii-CCMP3373.AAC.1